jgi:hypothetical protein
MTPMWSTITSSVFLLVGAGAVIFALIFQGREKVGKPEIFKLLHRYAGWTYFILFIIIFSFMVRRIERYWEQAEARIAFHIALAVGLLFLLLIKVAVPRYFPKLNKNLFTIGLLVYSLGFTLVNITAGYYIIRTIAGTPYISHDATANSELDLELGRQLFITKCSICHPLSQILVNRSHANWETVVNDMVRLADPRIDPDEATQILYFLTQTHSPQHVSPTPDVNPVQMYCTPCHSLDYIYVNQYTHEGWTQIVQKMTTISSGLVPEEKTSLIVDYLMEQQSQMGAGSTPAGQ